MYFLRFAEFDTQTIDELRGHMERRLAGVLPFAIPSTIVGVACQTEFDAIASTLSNTSLTSDDRTVLEAAASECRALRELNSRCGFDLFIRSLRNLYSIFTLLASFCLSFSDCSNELFQLVMATQILRTQHNPYLIMIFLLFPYRPPCRRHAFRV